MISLQTAFEYIDRFLKFKMKEIQIPGMAIAVTDREKLLKVSTCGFADVAAQAARATDHLLLRLQYC